MYIKIEQVIDEAKFLLGLRDTTLADADIEKGINEGAMHMGLFSNYVVSCGTYDIDCAKVELPCDFTELIGISYVNGDNCGCGCCEYFTTVAESLEEGGDGIPRPNMSTCCGVPCGNIYFYNPGVLTNFLGLGGYGCGYSGNFAINGNHIVFSTGIVAESVKVYYRSLNVDADGIMQIKPMQERGLAAYAAWKYASSGQNWRMYSPNQINDWKKLWAAQKAEQRGLDRLENHKLNKDHFFAIAQSIMWYGAPKLVG